MISVSYEANVKTNKQLIHAIMFSRILTKV